MIRKEQILKNSTGMATTRAASGVDFSVIMHIKGYDDSVKAGTRHLERVRLSGCCVLDLTSIVAYGSRDHSPSSGDGNLLSIFVALGSAGVSRARS